MRRVLLNTIASLGAAVSLAFPAAADEQRFEARLAGHAFLPAATFVTPPEGAPPGFVVSGRFAGPSTDRVARPGSVMGNTGAAYGSRALASPCLSRASPCRASRASSRPATAVIGC